MGNFDGAFSIVGIGYELVLDIIRSPIFTDYILM